MVYSFDGINWVVHPTFNIGNGSPLFDTAVYGVAWNGSLWVAAGYDTSQTKSLAYSSDSVTWNLATSASSFLTAKTAAAKIL